MLAIRFLAAQITSFRISSVDGKPTGDSPARLSPLCFSIRFVSMPFFCFLGHAFKKVTWTTHLNALAALLFISLLVSARCCSSIQFCSHQCSWRKAHRLTPEGANRFAFRCAAMRRASMSCASFHWLALDGKPTGQRTLMRCPLCFSRLCVAIPCCALLLSSMRILALTEHYHSTQPM